MIATQSLGPRENAGKADDSYSAMMIPTAAVQGVRDISSDNTATPIGKEMDITIH